MHLSPTAYAGRHPIAHVDAVPSRGDAVALLASALRLSLAAVLLYLCAQDWPSAQAWSEFDAIPLMHAKAQGPVPVRVDRDWLASGGEQAQALLHRAAQKGPRGLEFISVHGPLMTREHPLLALYPGRPPPELRGWLRDHSAEITGIAGAWMVFEFLVFAARARRAAQPRSL